MNAFSRDFESTVDNWIPTHSSDGKMFRLILLKKILKGIKTRYLGSKHERTPSSLHEYLDAPLPRKGLWRSWFPMLVAVPVAYYMILGATGNVLQYTLKTAKPKHKPASFMSLHSTALYLLHNDTHSETFPPIKIDANKSFLARIPARHEKKELLLDDNGFLPTFHIDKRQRLKKSFPFCPTQRIFEDTKGGKDKKKALVRAGPNRKHPYIFSHYDLKTVLEYRNQLSKGGYYESPLCRARHRVAVIVPYRNRERNLAVFLYVIHPFLIEQGLAYQIFVIEQSGRELFNKGRLSNVGFLEAQKHGKWGCMVFHDVDLLPTSDKIKYTCPTWPRHMCGSIIGRPETVKYKSHYGGVTVMTPSQYKKVNGYSNWYWGWGGEDTDMFWRIKNSGLALMRYNKSVAIYKALPHKRGPENPIRHQLLKFTKERYKTDGLSNCRYKIISKTMYHTYTHILVDINPDKENVTEFQLQWQ